MAHNRLPARMNTLIGFATGGIAALSLQFGCKPPEQPKTTQPAGSGDSSAASSSADSVERAESHVTSASDRVQQLLTACERGYAEATTYQDRGVVTTHIPTPDLVIDETKPFSTAYERSGRFRWEFARSVVPGGTPDQRYVVWSKDGKSFKSWWDLTKQSEPHGSLGMAMAGPTGVSGGSATAIIPLLEPGIEISRRLIHLVDPTETGSEEVNGVVCSRIEAKGFRNLGPGAYHSVSIWIDESNLIRKVAYAMDFEVDSGRGSEGSGKETITAMTSITFEPKINQPIDDEAFDPKVRIE